MGAWKSFRESEIVVLFICSLWLAEVLMYFVPMVVLLPLALIPGVGTDLYRHVIGFYDYYARIAVMCIPFSWCGMTVHTNDAPSFFKFKAKGASLCLANHGSRIDWVGAIFVGLCGGGKAAPRVGFVAEVTTGLMPIVGWSRVLFGDILLQRAFHKDGPRILKNIRGFAAAGIERLIMLAPEGTIADPGVAADEAYVAECRKFMAALGKPPMEYLLTPRYKGMSVFVTHAPQNVASVTMAFVRPDATLPGGGVPARIDPLTQRVVGGQNCAKRLDSPERYIPDLHTIFKGGLSLYFNFNMLSLYSPPLGEDCDAAGAAKIRDQLVAEQQRKDGDLACFDQHRTFPGLKDTEHLPLGAPGKQAWSRLGGGAEEVAMNGVLFAQTAATVWLWAWCAGVPKLAVCQRIGWIVGTFFVVHATSHKLGQWTSDGKSRESLPGETAIKALLAFLTGRDMNRGGAADASTAAAAAKKAN